MEHPTTANLAASLAQSIEQRKAKLGIIGMGYVGLPLAVAAQGAGFSVTGIDIDRAKVDVIEAGTSPIKSVSSDQIAKMKASGLFRATDEFSVLADLDAVMICVPTPLSKHRDPDLSFIERTADSITKYLRRGQLIILESSTYPGTTREVLIPILERGSGLRASEDFFVGYAPEREDPGNPDFETRSIPRVVGADDPLSTSLLSALYGAIVGSVVPVSSCATAEAVKLTENIFRAVNIALVNELKLIYGRMGVDIWEVIDAAKSKPFGFMPFYPGPGIGGHCIPIDPFYLTWKAREFDVPTRFIELAGEVNAEAPRHVVSALTEALGRKLQRSLNGSKILLLGMAYKKNVDDMRESPSLKLLEMLEGHGAEVSYYDPLIPVIPQTREHAALAGRKSIHWSKGEVEAHHAALICTDHDDVDYESLIAWSKLVVDTRNVTRHTKAHRDRIILA